MSRRKRIMQSAEREKSWAEKIKLAYCRCTHTNTIHAGGIGDCAMGGCTCREFKERIASAESPRTFKEVKAIMQGEPV